MRCKCSHVATQRYDILLTMGLSFLSLPSGRTATMPLNEGKAELIVMLRMLWPADMFHWPPESAGGCK
eukprot:scaffold501222_cov34-Prasinocladus_malaysianus.AAC.1